MTKSLLPEWEFTPEDIKKIRRHEKKSQKAFGAMMDYSREMINKIENRKEEISSNITLWLINHYGDRLKAILGHQTGEQRITYKSGVPVHELYLSVSLINDIKNGNAPDPAFYMKGNQFADCTFGALAKGDYSMSMIRSGDILLCREITDYQFIDHSCMYFIAAKNGFETCRFIHPNLDPKTILLKSDQEDVPASPLPKQYITHLYKIRGVIRSF